MTDSILGRSPGVGDLLKAPAAAPIRAGAHLSSRRRTKTRKERRRLKEEMLGFGGSLAEKAKLSFIMSGTEP